MTQKDIKKLAEKLAIKFFQKSSQKLALNSLKN